ncbi:MAG: 50S ribosomal protein L19 [Patescibacteria group bacterium]
MKTTVRELNAKHLKKDLPDIRPGHTVAVYQKIKEGDKERTQKFEGMVIARTGGSGINGTITVRKISEGIGVEKIFPIHLPTITKIEVVKKAKVRRAKLNYLRTYKKKLKEITAK